MRAVPAFQVTVSRLRWWRLLNFAVAGLSTAAVSAWFVSRAQPWGVIVTVVAMVGWLFWTARQHRRLATFTLRWDSQRWHLGPAGSGTPGKLGVALDLGPWMLLKFTAECVPARWHALPSWLPLQRHGLESQWHSLRCTVYGARPVSDAKESPP